MGWEKIEFKLSQADRALQGLSNAKTREEFYDGLSLFLSASRGAVAVLAFQYGLREFEIGEKAAGTNGHLLLDAAARTQRQSFDDWLRLAARPVLSHPLKQDRDADAHREGASSARFQLPLGAGLLLEPGRPTGATLAIRRNHRGQARVGLPLEGPRPEDFYFEFDRTRPALDVCRDYLASVRALIEAAKAHV